MHNTRRTRFLVLVPVAALLACPAAALAAPTPEEEARASGAPAQITSVEQLLTALEVADRGMETLAADIRYDRRLMLQGDQHVRQGRLLFRAEAPPSPGAPGAPGAGARRVFAIDFDRLYIGDRREDELQRWIFDGEWLAEIRPGQKQFVKRRIAPPDAGFDPLRIGEGPLPIPIGQKADDILARYDAKLLGSPEGLDDEPAMRKFVEGAHQLKLVPKGGREDDFEEIRLWYRWDGQARRFLPRLARTVNAAGDESYVQLINVTVNGPVEASAFDITAPAEGAGWDVQIVDDLRPENDMSAKEPADAGG